MLRERLERTREEELETPLDELVAIARGPVAPRARLATTRPTGSTSSSAGCTSSPAIVWIGDVVLLRRARQPPARARATSRPRARRRRRVVGDPRRRLLPDRRSSGSRRRSCRSRCTGTSGRPTGRGCPASRSSSSSTTSNARHVPDRPGGRRPRAVAGDRDHRSRCSSLAWVVYDVLCRLLGRNELVLGGAARSASSPLPRRASSELFSAARGVPPGRRDARDDHGRERLLRDHPGHWELVRAKQAGREPDPSAGLRGKQRSVHNNYLTLPVLFAMLAGHFPFTYGHEHAWAVLVALMAIGAWIRHYFNLPPRGPRRSGGSRSRPRSAIAAIAVADPADDGRRRAAGARAVPFAQAQAIVAAALRPVPLAAPDQPGFSRTAGDRLRHAGADRRASGADRAVAVELDAMPLGNATDMTQAERDALGAWIRAGREDQVFRRCSRSPPASSDFVAALEEERAPQTVAAFRRLLPLESRIIHVPLERRGLLDPVRRPRRRHRARERDVLPGAGRASLLLPRRSQRDRDPVPLRRRRFAEQGRAARRQPLRDGARRHEKLAELGRTRSGKAPSRSASPRSSRTENPPPHPWVGMEVHPPPAASVALNCARVCDRGGPDLATRPQTRKRRERPRARKPPARCPPAARARPASG